MWSRLSLNPSAIYKGSISYEEFQRQDQRYLCQTDRLQPGRHNIHFYGGCPGNLSAISKLLEGADARHAVELLKGNKCGNKSTSCADQLAQGVEEALKEAH